MFTLEEKIRIIERSNSMLDLNKDVLPEAHRENYYFVSYSHKDYKKVIKDILLLEANGVNIWYDCDMHIGENWEEIAETYITKYQCKGIIFYLSENSIASSACNKEVQYVLENNKQFFSINIPLEDGKMRSGHSMLLTLKEQGLAVSDKLISSFEKVFSDKNLYLSYDDSIQRKIEQIEKLKGEDLFVFTHDYSTYYSYSSKLTECRDNSLINLKLKNNYQINAPGDKEFGKTFALRYIDKCAFANSFKLKEVELPEQIYEIGEYAFINCYKLASVNLNCGGLYYIRENAFSKCKSLAIEEIDCKFLEKSAFSDCTSLKNLNLKVNEIGVFCFLGCTSLESVIFTKELITISDYAFRGCKNLRQIGMEKTPYEISAKNSVLEINGYCFEYCNGLPEITFKGNINFENARSLFYSCGGLKKVVFNLNKKLAKLNSYIFAFCRNLVDVQGIEKVKIYENNCFYECNNLKNVNLENAVEIHEQAFACTALEEVYLPNVKRIEAQAFAATDTLTKVVIGKKLKELASSAFYGLDGLKEIEIQSKKFKYAYDSFTFVEPEILTVSNVNFLVDFLEKGSEKLKTVYVESGLVTLQELNELGLFIFKMEESDKEGYDKFIVSRQNKYGIYVEKLIILTLKNGKQDYVFCQEADYDESRGEHYLITGDGEKYYESEIQTISMTYSF